MNKQLDIQRGDWIRFQRGYSTVIGEVQYRRRRIGVCDEIITDIGSVSVDQILEVRTDTEEIFGSSINE